MMIAVAVPLFVAAAIIDFPYPAPPGPTARNWGNFLVSLGFVCLAAGLAQQTKQ